MTGEPDDDDTRHRELDSTDPPRQADKGWGADGLTFLRSPSHPGDLGVLGGFRVLRVIARGGMGVVFAAFDPLSEREVAIKVIRPDALTRPGLRERFDREARALAQLDHPNVVPLYQAGEDRGVPYLVMPLLTGEPLDQRLARSTLSVPELERLARDVAHGLKAAHLKGLIHRDLKPSNLWLDGATAAGWERVRVFDFGLVSGPAGDRITATDHYLGTPAFTSPEQARLMEATPSSDLFSLGGVLYRAATGQNPFSEDGPRATLHAVATAEVRPPADLRPDLPAGWSALILKLLAKDPAARPPSATALLHELDRLAPRDRRAWWLVGVVAAFALVVVPLVLLLNAGGRGTPGTTLVTVPVTDAAPLTARVDVQIFNKFKPMENVSVGRAGSLPVEKGERYAYTARANRPAYLYLFEFDEDGQVQLRYPWKDGGATPRPAVETPRREVIDPDEKKVTGYLMEGDTNGLITVILVARTTPLTLSDAEVRGWFADLAPVRNPPSLDVVAWYDNGVPVRDDPTRGGSAKAGEVEFQPAMALQNELTRRIKPHADFVTAVQFGKRGAR